MIDFLLRNQDSLIVNSIFLVAGAGLGPLWAALRDKNSANCQNSSKSFPQLVDKSNNIFITPPSKSNNPDDILPIIYALIVGCCFVYVYWRSEVIITLTSITFFLIAFFSSASIYAYIKNRIGGIEWIVYLSAIIAVTFFTFVLIISAIQPTYAPESFANIQDIFHSKNLSGILNILPWLLTHVFGVFLLFYTQIRMAASLAHYSSIIHIDTTGNKSGAALFLAQKTRNYRSPVKNISLLIVLSVASYFLINGHTYVWYSNYIK